MAIDFDAIHDLRLRISAPAALTANTGTCHIALALDGREIWSVDTTFYPVTADTVSSATNRIGASSCEEVFSGAILKLSFPEEGAP